VGFRQPTVGGSSKGPKKTPRGEKQGQVRKSTDGLGDEDNIYARGQAYSKAALRGRRRLASERGGHKIHCTEGGHRLGCSIIKKSGLISRGTRHSSKSFPKETKNVGSHSQVGYAMIIMTGRDGIKVTLGVQNDLKKRPTLALKKQKIHEIVCVDSRWRGSDLSFRQK